MFFLVTGSYGSISHEACSLAGTLNLGKLICIYDDNGFQLMKLTNGLMKMFAQDSSHMDGMSLRMWMAMMRMPFQSNLRSKSI